jgi:predicted PurR-regulated permease PerM
VTEIVTKTPEVSDLAPGWLQRLAAVGWRLLTAIALALVLLWIAALLWTVTASILVAAIVAATFAPFVLALRDRGWSRVKAAAAVFLGAGFVILVTLAMIAIAFLPYVSSTIAALGTGLTTLQQDLAGLNIPPEVGVAIEHATEGIQAWLSNAVSAVAGDIASAVTVAILATFLTFFFLMDGDKAWVWTMSSANSWRRETIATSGHVALERVGGYLRGTAVIAAVDGIAEGLFLVILGVPLAGPLAVIVFFGRFIPYIGGLVTTILLLIVTNATAGHTAAVVLFVLIAILNVIQGKFLAPVIYQKTVHIHPAIVLIALPAGAAVAGVIGLFAAIPVVAFALAIAGALVSVLGVEPTGEVPRNPIVPIWLDRLGQWSWRLLVSIGLLAVVIATVVQVPIVVLPIVLGIVLAATLAPLGEHLERRGWSRSRAALGATFGAFVGIVVIVGLTIVSLAGSASEMISQASAGAASADTSTGGNAGVLLNLVQTFGTGILDTIAGVLSSLSGLAVVILLSTLLTYYFMRDGDAFWRGFLGRVEPGRRSHVEAAGSRAFNVLGGYMIGTGAISLFGAATQFLIMTILGIPLALPLAVFALFAGFIPYIGSLVSTGLAFLVTVATGTPQDVAIMAIYTIVFNIVQGNVVAPLVYSRVVSLHPAVILVAIPAGNAIAGVIGMFLVVPFLGVVAAVWRTVLRVLDTEAVQALDPGRLQETAAAEPAPPAPLIL